MRIEPGQELLHYRLAEKIGEGGMGVVWKAVDTTLNRDVAIKILPEGFAGEADRLARFEREAKLLASLNHPNIAGIYGIHKVSGTAFLSMELIDGEDLQQRLSRGTLSRGDALNYALQIATAFEAAHESGIIHRDLKPANVKLTPAGQIKVLDFGLAKALSTDPSGPGTSPSMSPTLTSAGTIAGMVLGTASYMSPEQAKGKEVDRRADIWSFGVLLFEMLTGRKLFEGEGISETLAAVIMKDVDWGGLPADTPQSIRRLLERCLHRDPNSRLRDIGDARIAIQEALQAPAESAITTAATSTRPGWLSILPWGIAAAALAAFAWAWIAGGSAPAPSPVMRFTMTLAQDQPLENSPIPMLAISPDGTRIAYVGRTGNDSMIFLRHTHQSEAQPLKGTEGADNPFFSPDGEWIGFEADGKLKKISVLGGPPTTLCDAPRLRGASWGTDGTIVFTPDRGGGLARVSEAGGEPESLTLPGVEADLNDPSHRWPDLLPGNRHVIFTSATNNSNFETAEIAALSLADKSLKTLVKGGTFGRFVPPGFLVYARENTLFAARFDPETLEVTGPAVPVLEDINGASNYGSKHLTFSDNGTLLYLKGASDFGLESLHWVGRDGKEEPASAHEQDYGWIGISPDGKHVALEIIAEDSSDIWVLELERDTLTRLTFQETADFDPVWTPDGEWITFSSLRENGEAINLYQMRADGTGEVQRLTTSERSQSPGAWSPDGKALAFTERGGDTGMDMMIYRPGADPEVDVFLATDFAEWGPRFSPDGRWISFGSNMSGDPEIYVRSASGVGQQVKISTDGGLFAAWNPAGKELLYRNLAGKMMSVSFTVEGDAFRPTLPQELFDFSAPPHSFVFNITTSGDQFLSYKDLGGGEVTRREPVAVINWIDELEAKVPAPR